MPEPTNSPESASNSKCPPTQPPTTITAYFTPVTGHFSTAYAARVSRDLALCSRFSFNVYDYESDWTMGGEWWLRRRKPVLPESATPSTVLDQPTTFPVAMSLSEGTDPPQYRFTDEIQGVVKARVSTSSVSLLSILSLCFGLTDLFQNVALMWEGRIRNALVSFGIISNLVNRSKPITAVGLELAYFSSE